MGKMTANILYWVANVCCVAADHLSPPPMQPSAWKRAEAEVEAMASVSGDEDTLPHKVSRFQWFDPDSPPDPTCVMVELQSRWTGAKQPYGEIAYRWKCWDCNTSGPAVDHTTAGTGAVAHLTEMHPDERWPEIGIVL